MLRFMVWLCLRDNPLAGLQMCIVTGPRIDLAIVLIDGMKKLFVAAAADGNAGNTKQQPHLTPVAMLKP
jgi:hypothetical protein